MHPIQLALHVREPMRNINLVSWLHRPANSLHFSTKATGGYSRQIDIHLGTRPEMAELPFTKIGQDIPPSSIEQREHGNAGGGVRANRDVQADDPTWKRCDDFAVGK